MQTIASELSEILARISDIRNDLRLEGGNDESMAHLYEASKELRKARAALKVKSAN